MIIQVIDLEDIEVIWIAQAESIWNAGSGIDGLVGFSGKSVREFCIFFACKVSYYFGQ
jgi:hypothetical protein